MDCHDIQQNALSAIEEIRKLSAPLLCPKPRRTGVLSNTPCKDSDAESREELLEMFLQETCGVSSSSSPPFPFLSGSPPARAANPLIKNPQFAEGRYPFPVSISVIPSPLSLPSSSSSPSASSSLPSPPSASCKGKCVRMKTALKPAKVRVEGFESHVPAVAYSINLHSQELKCI